MANVIKAAERRRQKLQFEVTDLSGGFVSQHSSYNVKENYLEDVQNMEIVQGMWQKRKGYNLSGQYTAIVSTPGAVRGAHVYNSQDSLNVLVVSNNNLYVTKSLTSTGYHKLFSGRVPSSPKVSFVDYQDDCYIASGRGKVLKYDGNSLTEVPSPQGDILASYDNRLLISGIKGDSLVIYYSDRGKGERWDALSYVVLNGKSSEEITAMFPALGKLFIFTNQNIYSLAGGMEAFSISLEVSGLGAVRGNSVGMYGNKFYFVGDDYKIYEYDGGNFPKEISVNISHYIEYSFPKDALRNAEITEYGNSIWFTLDNSKERSERITLVYYPDYRAWTKFKGIPASKYLKIDDRLYFIGVHNIGSIYQYDTSFSDEIYAIDAYLKTTKWSFDNLEHLKRFKKLYLRGAIQSGGGNGFNVDLLIDESQVASIRVTSDIASETELWGDNAWGELYWGNAMATAGTAWGQSEWSDVEWGGGELVFSPRWGTSTWNSCEWGDKRDGALGDDVGKIYSKMFLSQNK